MASTRPLETLKKKSTGHGGKRPGTGRPKGSLNKATIEQKELERQFKAAIAAEIDPIAKALVKRCLGVEHLMAKSSKSGKWKSVADPDEMEAVLNGPEEYRYLSAKDADVNAIREALNRLFGQAKQSIEVEDVTPIKDMTDEELKALAAELAQKL